MSEDAISRLNELLEAERAGVETLAWLSQQESMQDMLKDLKEISRDESWSAENDTLNSFLQDFEVGSPSLILKLQSSGVL